MKCIKLLKCMKLIFARNNYLKVMGMTIFYYFFPFFLLARFLNLDTSYIFRYSQFLYEKSTFFYKSEKKSMSAHFKLNEVYISR